MATRLEVNDEINELLTPGGSGDKITATEHRESMQVALDYVDQEIAAVQPEEGVAGVATFNGRSGTVTPQSGDYTKSMVGLGSVDNTADTAKPVSTAQATAITAAQSAAQAFAIQRANHTGTQAATTITEDSTHRFTTDAEKTTWNANLPTVITFTSAIPFTRDYTKMNHAVTGAIHFTADLTGAIDGGWTMVKLTANGVNDPTWASNLNIISGTYDNAADRINNIYFFYNEGIVEVMIRQSVVIDLAPPTVTSRAVADATHITLVFSEAVSGTTAGYTFLKNGVAYTPSGVTGTTSRVFTFGTSMVPGDVITVAYSSTTGNTVDAASNPLATFSAASVTNGLSVPVILSAAGGIATGGTSLGISQSFQAASLVAAARVTTAGVADTIKFPANGSPLTSGTAFAYQVYRPVGGNLANCDQVGADIVIPVGSVVAGINTFSIAAPITVAAGDIIVMKIIGNTGGFLSSVPGSNGDLKYTVSVPAATTGYDWDAQVPSAAYHLVQLIQS